MWDLKHKVHEIADVCADICMIVLTIVLTFVGTVGMICMGVAIWQSIGL